MGYNINDVYQSNSDFLKADDIGQNFWTVTISTVEMKEFDNGERKLATSFNELDKSLLLNMTNARTISDMYGGDTDMWVGRQIMLFTAPVDYQGKKVNAIRVRGPAPQQQTYNPVHHSPQRPLNKPAGGYAQASGGTAAYDDRNPPPYTEAPSF
jgi:hypothetical protein